jgi:capsular polysaccharide biosynthesis protein
LEIKNSLSKKGFSIIRLSDLSFTDQVNLFNNASKIVGLHGAGFANLTFCKPNTTVIELKAVSAGFMYSNLSKKLNLDYRDISLKTENFHNNDQQGSINVPLSLLEKKIH